MRAFARWLLTLFRPQPPPVLVDRVTLADALRSCTERLNDAGAKRGYGGGPNP